MGTKMAVSFANIFMAEVETDIINQSPNKPLIWKKYIDDIFSLWNTNKEAIHNFTKLANSFHPTIKFTAEISDTEIKFLDTCVYKATNSKSTLFLMCARTLNRQRLFNTRILTPATLQASGKASSKATL